MFRLKRITLYVSNVLNERFIPDSLVRDLTVTCVVETLFVVLNWSGRYSVELVHYRSLGRGAIAAPIVADPLTDIIHDAFH